jgi:hypothetical protein
VERFNLKNIHEVEGLEVQVAIAKFKKYRSPCSDQILLEIIEARNKTLLSGIHTH